jgi:hypothetical protein
MPLCALYEMRPSIAASSTSFAHDTAVFLVVCSRLLPPCRRSRSDKARIQMDSPFFESEAATSSAAQLHLARLSIREKGK